MVGTSNLGSWNGHWWYSNGFWGTVVLDVFGPIHLSDIRILWLSNFFVPVSGTILWFCNRLARSAVRFVLNIWSIPAVIFFGPFFVWYLQGSITWCQKTGLNWMHILGGLLPFATTRSRKFLACVWFTIVTLFLSSRTNRFCSEATKISVWHSIKYKLQVQEQSV